MFIGLLLALPHAISKWLDWQKRKQVESTVLTYGALTPKAATYANTIVWVIYVVVFFTISGKYEWRIIIALAIMLIVGKWLAIAIERFLYKGEIGALIAVISSDAYIGIVDPVAFRQRIERVVPVWWIKLMPKGEQYKYYKFIFNVTSKKYPSPAGNHMPYFPEPVMRDIAYSLYIK